MLDRLHSAIQSNMEDEDILKMKHAAFEKLSTVSTVQMSKDMVSLLGLCTDTNAERWSLYGILCQRIIARFNLQPYLRVESILKLAVQQVKWVLSAQDTYRCQFAMNSNDKSDASYFSVFMDTVYANKISVWKGISSCWLKPMEESCAIPNAMAVYVGLKQHKAHMDMVFMDSGFCCWKLVEEAHCTHSLSVLCSQVACTMDKTSVGTRIFAQLKLFVHLDIDENVYIPGTVQSYMPSSSSIVFQVDAMVQNYHELDFDCVTIRKLEKWYLAPDQVEGAICLGSIVHERLKHISGCSRLNIARNLRIDIAKCISTHSQPMLNDCLAHWKHYMDYYFKLLDVQPIRTTIGILSDLLQHLKSWLIHVGVYIHPGYVTYYLEKITQFAKRTNASIMNAPYELEHHLFMLQLLDQWNDKQCTIAQAYDNFMSNIVSPSIDPYFTLCTTLLHTFTEILSSIQYQHSKNVTKFCLGNISIQEWSSSKNWYSNSRCTHGVPLAFVLLHNTLNTLGNFDIPLVQVQKIGYLLLEDTLFSIASHYETCITPSEVRKAQYHIDMKTLVSLTYTTYVELTSLLPSKSPASTSILQKCYHIFHRNIAPPESKLTEIPSTKESISLQFLSRTFPDEILNYPRTKIQHYISPK